MSKKIILCADDFGQNQTISEAIIDLLAKQRLSATSCMVTSDYWPIAAKSLQAYQHQVDIGLHFDLTEGKSLSSLILDCYVGRISQQKIVMELIAQIESFRNHFGKLPDYIDGHQHIQQFPVIRQAIKKVYLQYYPEKNAYVRVLKLQANDFKQWVLRMLGAKAFERILLENAIPHNKSFAGIYNLQADNDYRKLFQKFLKFTSNNGIIMCHPGKKIDSDQDAIAAARVNEYQYFNSEEFISDLHAAGCELSRFDFLF